jgi:hypothetical protein
MCQMAVDTPIVNCSQLPVLYSEWGNGGVFSWFNLACRARCRPGLGAGRQSCFSRATQAAMRTLALTLGQPKPRYLAGLCHGSRPGPGPLVSLLVRVLSPGPVAVQAVD